MAKWHVCHLVVVPIVGSPRHDMYNAHSKILYGHWGNCNKRGIRWEVVVAHHVLLADEPIEDRSFVAAVSVSVAYTSHPERATSHKYKLRNI